MRGVVGIAKHPFFTQDTKTANKANKSKSQSCVPSKTRWTRSRIMFLFKTGTEQPQKTIWWMGLVYFPPPSSGVPRQLVSVTGSWRSLAGTQKPAKHYVRPSAFWLAFAWKQSRCRWKLQWTSHSIVFVFDVHFCFFVLIANTTKRGATRSGECIRFLAVLGKTMFRSL